MFTNDIGTNIILTIYDQAGTLVNVSGASTKELHFRKPSGTTLQKTAVFQTNGTDGKIKYVTLANDLNEPGIWEVQAYIVLAGGSWASDTQRFTVYKKLI